MRFWMAGVLGMVLATGVALAQEPVGEQFQVNSYTTNQQILSSVAVQPQGDFVVVWGSDGSDGTDISKYSIQAQRHDADGAPVGGNSRSTPTRRATKLKPQWPPMPKATSSWCGGAMARTEPTRTGGASRRSATMPTAYPWGGGSKAL